MSDSQIYQVSGIVLDRIKKWKDLEKFSYLVNRPSFDDPVEKAKVFGSDSQPTIAKEIIKSYANKIRDMPLLTEAEVIESIGCILKENKNPSLTEKQLYEVLRYVTTGSTSGPGFSKIAMAIGKQELLCRLERWI